MREFFLWVGENSTALGYIMIMAGGILLGWTYRDLLDAIKKAKKRKKPRIR